MRVLSTIIIERSFDLAIAAGLIISLLPFALGLSWAKPVAIATLSVVFSDSWCFFCWPGTATRWKPGLIEKARVMRNIRKHVFPQVDAFFLGLIALRNPRSIHFQPGIDAAFMGNRDH